LSRAGLTLCMTLLAASAGCYPYHGPIQVEIPETPILIVNGATGEPVPRALILPRYQTETAVATPRFWVEQVFVYHHGDRFPLKRPTSSGVVWWPGAVMTGHVIVLEGTLVVAPGYRPCYTDSLWDRSLDREFALLPVVDKKSVEYLLYVYNVLCRESVTGKNSIPWGVGERYRVEILLTPEERASGLSFLAEELRQFNARIPSLAPDNSLRLPDDASEWRAEMYGRCVPRN